MNKEVKDMTAQIAAWKKKHGDNIFAYEADGKVAYLRTADRTVVAAATAKGANNVVKYAEVIIDNTWLGGDEELRTEDKYFLGLMQKVTELIEIKTGELKKL